MKRVKRAPITGGHDIAADKLARADLRKRCVAWADWRWEDVADLVQ